MNSLMFNSMPPSCNGGGIFFSSSQTNFPYRYACHILFKRFLRVHSEIDSVCLYHDLQTAGLCFYPKLLMLIFYERRIYEPVENKSLSSDLSHKSMENRIQALESKII